MIVENKQNILDFVLSEYGSIEAFFDFYLINTGVTSIAQTLDFGQNFTTNDFQTIPVTFSGNSIGVFTPTGTTEIMFKQSIWDLALQYYGDLGQSINLIVANPSIDNINNVNLEGINFSYTIAQIPNTIVSFYNSNNMILATNTEPTALEIPIIGKSFNNDFNSDFF